MIFCLDSPVCLLILEQQSLCISAIWNLNHPGSQIPIPYLNLRTRSFFLFFPFCRIFSWTGKWNNSKIGEKFTAILIPESFVCFFLRQSAIPYSSIPSLSVLVSISWVTIAILEESERKRNGIFPKPSTEDRCRYRRGIMGRKSNRSEHRWISRICVVKVSKSVGVQLSEKKEKKTERERDGKTHTGQGQIGCCNAPSFHRA